VNLFESTAADIRALNKRLVEGLLFFPGSVDDNNSDRLFDSLKRLGFDPSGLIFLSLTPDGDGTVIGRFLTVQNGLYRFDLDLHHHQFSIVERVQFRDLHGDPRSLASLESVEETVGRALLEERSQGDTHHFR
jgi:hypothetical protein